MSLIEHKRSVDLQVISEWVEPRARVLDLGCGRGVLLETLVHSKQIQAVGVDLSFQKISACVRRGLSAYQGDIMAFMKAFPDGHFDRVICSRTLEEVNDPARVIAEALRVGRALTVGFVNFGFWKNRWQFLLRGRKPHNEVYTSAWHESRPTNRATIADFEAYCAENGIRIVRRVYLAGDWKSPVARWPNLLAGYALYDLSR